MFIISATETGTTEAGLAGNNGGAAAVTVAVTGGLVINVVVGW